MSWLSDFVPGAEERKQAELARLAAGSVDAPPDSPMGKNDTYPKVKDPYGRQVSTKQANRPFLAYQQYRKEEEEARQARKKRNKERLEKMARGEPVEPEEKEPDEEIGLWGLVKFLIFLLATIMLAGHFITGDFLWDYQGKYRYLKTFWPTDQTLFSESQLAKFDGTNEALPVYLAIDHDVYDVSSNRRTYGPGGSYGFMAGKDAARAFATGCFKEHRTHDIRGLDEDEERSLQHWKKFFENHKSYRKVGKVVHRPINPADPYPEDCDPEGKAKKAEARKKENQQNEEDARRAAKQGNSAQGSQNARKEL